MHILLNISIFLTYVDALENTEPLKNINHVQGGVYFPYLRVYYGLAQHGSESLLNVLFIMVILTFVLMFEKKLLH